GTTEPDGRPREPGRGADGPQPADPCLLPICSNQEPEQQGCLAPVVRLPQAELERGQPIGIERPTPARIARRHGPSLPQNEGVSTEDRAFRWLLVLLVAAGAFFGLAPLPAPSLFAS